MSGIIGSKINIRGSGRIAKLGTDGQVLTSSGAGVAANYEDIAAGISWQAVETGSTMTAVAGEGYWVDTTSNACTITLPASASNGDTIVFTDYARTWGTNGIVIDSNGLNYQGDDDTYTMWNTEQMVKPLRSFILMQLMVGFQLLMRLLRIKVRPQLQMLTEYLGMVLLVVLFQ